LKALAKKLKEEIDFNRKPCFWPRDLWPFDLWPQKKDGHNPWGTIYLPCKFGKDPPTGSGLNRWGPTNQPPNHPTKVLVIPSRRASLTLKGPAKLITHEKSIRRNSSGRVHSSKPIDSEEWSLTSGISWLEAHKVNLSRLIDQIKREHMISLTSS